MIKYRKVKAGKKHIDALMMKLGAKNLIVLKGSRGYAMCGYLNLGVSQKFHDVAVKIVGVSNFKEALNSKVHACTYPARRLGIYKGQAMRDVLKIIA